MKPVIPIALMVMAAMPVGAKVIEKIVAVVNDEIVLLSEVDDIAGEELARSTEEAPDDAVRELRVASLRKEVIEQRVDELILAHELKRINLSVTDDEVARGIDDTMKRNKMTEKTMRETLKTHKLSWAGFKRQIRRDLERMRLMQVKLEQRIKVSDTDIKRYYTKYVNQLAQNARLRLCQIHFKMARKLAPDERSKRMKLVDEVHRRARDGEDFAELTKKYSEGPGLETCGDVGWLSRGMLVDAFERIAYALKPGEVSAPIRTAEGVVILKLKEREAPDVKPLEEIRDVLKGRLMQEEQEKQLVIWLREARKKSFVDLRPL